LLALLAASLAACVPQGGPAPTAQKGAPTEAAGAPAEVTATAGDRQVTLVWKPVAGAESYNLYWLSAPGVSPENGNRIVGVASPFVHKELANGVGYSYRVAAVKGGKESGASPAASATPNAPRTAVLSPQKPELRTEDFVAVLVKAGDTLASLAEKYLGSKDKAWLLADFNGVGEAAPGMELIVPLKPFNRGGLSPARYRSVPVLTYHNLSKTETNIMTVQDTAFEAQMKFLKDNNYRVISLDQFYDFVKFNAAIPENSVIITFDDGWRSTYEIGLPILKKYGFQATLFVYTDFIGQNADKSLTWEMVQELQNGGVDIQCHSKSHRDLTQMNANEQFEQYYNALNLEMSLPTSVVQDKLKHRCNYLAYPYGATNRLVSSLAEKYGYRLAFTVNRGSASFFEDLYRIDRSMIYGSYDLKKFEENLAQYRSEALQ
jgi:peptidoglycan/xylan/chitin deacetylase (PgdA/CDA1 family)